MLLTRSLVVVGRAVHGCRLAGVGALLVTGCTGGPGVGSSGAGHSELGGAAAGAAGQGQLLAAAAGRGELTAAGGGAGHSDAAAGGADGAIGGSASLASAGSAGAEPKHYPGQGFVVHEWGTDTIVVGSDGSLQRGLHHEEEDLPSFVYDRIKAGTLIGVPAQPHASVTPRVKMETPVTYFYSPSALQVSAHVEFPRGVLTQWYPMVSEFLPPVAAIDSATDPVTQIIADPVLDPYFPFNNPKCRVQLASISGGLLDWGTFSVQGRGFTPEPALPSAPLEQFGWSHARAVDANVLLMPSGESERFLFYRGVGEFDLPVKAQAGDAERITLRNDYAEAVGHVFLLDVNHDQGAFVEHARGIAPGQTLADTVPSLDGAQGVAAYAEQLSVAVTRALDSTGLYHDEAVAMVNTWRRQWFRTPGVRALYLVPQSWTDQSIPLSINPKPDATLRVMLVRVELITREQERLDVSALDAFVTDAPRAAAYFTALGRFAEPRLRRALQLSPSPLGEQYLSRIIGTPISVVSGE